MSGKIGHLGIPQVECEPAPYRHSIQTRYSWLYKQALDSELGKWIFRKLSEDVRVQALTGQLISNGSGASQFDIEQLAMWYLYCTNHFGPDTANRELQSWLDADEIEIVSTLWVVGFNLEKSLVLAGGYEIIKIEEMADSDEKEFFQTPHEGILSYENLPKCAITKTNTVKKVWTFESQKQNKYQGAVSKLYDLAFLLNAIEGTTCVPHYQTAYSPVGVPLGFFRGTSGGRPIFDVATSSTSRLDDSAVPTINALFAAYEGNNASEKNRLQLILTRLSQAKRRFQIEDQLLDLGIAMEMLLLDDNEKDQLALQFRLRGSWLVGESAVDRQLKWGVFQEIYSARSSVAHTGILFRNDGSKVARVRDRIPEYFALAEKCIQKVVLKGTPDWRDLVLGQER